MGEHGKDHVEAGISKEQWQVLVQPALWGPEERRTAEAVLEEVISAGLLKAGLGAIQLPAEYVAKAVAMFVDSRNWLNASYFGRNYFNAAKAVAEGTIEGREVVTPELMLVLVLLAHDHSKAKRAGPQDVADSQVQDIEPDAPSKVKR
mgnify:CR=1 FL=1